MLLQWLWTNSEPAQVLLEIEYSCFFGLKFAAQNFLFFVSGRRHLGNFVPDPAQLLAYKGTPLTPF